MLTKRQLLVLKEIIRLFTESGQPVGSKTLMQELPVHVSSATIRNDMASLEDAGLITKTHSSSGRVPRLKAIATILIIWSSQCVFPTVN